MGELVAYESSHDVEVKREPTIVLEEAKKAAKALKDVVSQKAKPVIFNGEQYLEFEDLQTLGRFYGVTAKVTSTMFIQYGEIQGFEARAVAIRGDGSEISAAEAMCMNDEANWKSKPLFQLRSMAQTRASAKALRNVLAWVVVLAGYKPTPAEEMTGQENAKKPPMQEPKKKGSVDAHPPEEHPSVTVAVSRVEIKTGKGPKGPWTLYIVHAGTEKYNTFSDTFGQLAQRSIDEQLNAVIAFSETEKGKKIENIMILEDRQPGEEDAQ